jgi:rod shape-determining protein MreD
MRRDATVSFGGLIRQVVTTLALVASALPVPAAWPAGPMAASVAALLPVVVIHHVAIRGAGDPIGPVAAFTAGLLVDAAAGGPLGHYGLLFLLAAGLTDVFGRVRASPLFALATLAVVLAAVVAAITVLAAASHGAMPSIASALTTLAVALLVLLPGSFLLGLLVRADRSEDGER